MSGEKELVVLRVDNRPAEDESYVIGAVWVHTLDEIDALQTLVDNLRARLIAQNDDYQEDDLLRALQERGLELADPPTELLVG